MLTPWRKRLYHEIAKLELSGDLLDLGGSRKSGYHELIKGVHRITVVNMDEAAGLDLRFDLEKSFPTGDVSYDAVMAFNVLEHVFNYQNVLKESYRVLKPCGALVIGVPFLIQYHPSPNDFWRYSQETLERILKSAGYSDISIKAIGSGPFTASAQLLSTVFRIFPADILMIGIAGMLDDLLSLAVPTRVLRKRFPLGFFVTAKK